MRILHSVPLIGQPTRGTCWAASIAMMLAWRRTPMDVYDVRVSTPVARDPSGMNAGQVASDRVGLGLAPQDATAVLLWWGLALPAGQTFTVQDVEQLLRRRGPLLATTYRPGSQRPHFLVITGLEGDGTSSGTQLHINDPWRDGYFPGFNQPRPDSDRPNPGSQYRQAYHEFESLHRRFVSNENQRLGDIAQGLGGAPARERWTETIRRNPIHAPEADCNYVAHWP